MFNRIRALYHRVYMRLTRPQPVHHDGALQDYDYRINDGVSYDLPVIIPDWLRKQADKNPELAKALTESLLYLPANNQNATYRDNFSNPYRTGYDLPIVQTTEDPLKEWDWATRRYVLSNCHAAYSRNPLANAAVNFTTDFVIGDGFNLLCKNPEVEEVLQAFIDNPDNAIRTYERQAVNDLQVDGELILRFFTKAGEVVAAPQRPWELEWIKTQMGFFRRAETYHFQYYETKGDDPTGGTETKPVDVAAKDILFVAINNHAYELRGRPELYRILPWLRADKDFLEDRVRQNRWRNALLWDVAVENATPATIAAIAARWRKPPSPGSAYVHTANEVVQPLNNPNDAGDAANDGRAIRLMSVLGMRLPEYFFGDGQNANMATATKQELPALTKFESFQQIMVEQVWMPVFKRVLQAAIDNGDLPEEIEECDSDGKPMMEDATEEEYEASQETETQEATQLGISTEYFNFIRNSYPNADDIFRSWGYRHDAKYGWIQEAPNGTPIQPPEPRPTVQDIAKSAVDGTIPPAPEKPPQKPKMIRTLDAFEVSYEPVTSQDLTALWSMLSGAQTAGMISKRTATEELGFDATIEKRRMEEENEADLMAYAQGKKAPPPELFNPLAMQQDMADKAAQNGSD